MFLTALARPDCPKCYNSKEKCSNMKVSFYAVNQVKGRTFPGKGEPPLHDLNVCNMSPVDSKTYKKDLIIENYRMSYPEDSIFKECENNIVLDTFGGMIDNAADQILTNVACNNCQKESLVRFMDPNPKKASWKGGCGELVCTGKRNLMVTDTDGKFMGKNGVSVLVPNGSGVKHPKCKKIKAWNGYECEGYVYGKLEFEEFSVTRLRRLLAPVNITSEYMHNTLNQWFEWSWEADEPLDKRIPRFWGITELNKRIEL